MKEGQKAIEELNDAMKKGNVLSEKVLPFVAEIAKQMAAGGIEEARLSSFSQQNRFMNQLRTGRNAFRQNGGESGVAFFWQMMQKMGTWWTSNAAGLGRAFETTMYWLDAFRLGVYEFAQFISNGTHNSFTDWVRSLGVDVDAIRDALLRLRDSILKLLGINSTNVSTILETIIDRLIIFVNRLQEIANGATRAVNGIGQVKEATVDKNQKYLSSDFIGRTKMFTEEALRNVANMTPFGKIINANRPTMLGGIGEIIGGTKDATAAATGALYDLGTGQGNKLLPLPPTVPSWTPTTPADLSTGMTRRSDFGNSTQNVNVKLEVQGNAEVINALIDDRTRAQFPVFLSQELTKAIVQAPKQ